MKSVRLILAMTALFALAASWNLGQGPATPVSFCAIAQEALQDYQHIRSGVTRQEVEKYFVLDGGLQFADNSRYVYRKCRYIKLVVQFKSKNLSGSASPSPGDTVTKVSKLFLDYPAKD